MPETREGVFVGLRVSILRVADAAPGSLEAVEGVETAACAVLRRRISAAIPGEVSSEGEGTISDCGLEELHPELRRLLFWRKAKCSSATPTG